MAKITDRTVERYQARALVAELDAKISKCRSEILKATDPVRRAKLNAECKGYQQQRQAAAKKAR